LNLTAHLSIKFYPTTMKNILLSTLSAVTAALFLVGCGNAESPFKLNPRADSDSVRVQVVTGKTAKVFVNHKRLKSPLELPSVLNEIGLRQPKRPVLLVVDDNPDIQIELDVQRFAIGAGLGDVEVMERSEERGSFHTRPVRKPGGAKPGKARPADTAQAAPAPVAVPTPSPTPPAPAPQATPAAPSTEPAAAKPAPAAVAAAPEQPPAQPAAPVVPISVSGQPDGSFVVEGKAASRDALSSLLGEIGAARPGVPINYTTNPSEPDDSALFFYKAAKAAKLGPITAK
jgi:hypothetical protein